MWCHGWPHNGLMTGSWCHVTDKRETNQRHHQYPSGQWEARTRHERMGSVISAHITHHYIVSPHIGASRLWLSPVHAVVGDIYWNWASWRKRHMRPWALSSARPLARHKNEDEVTEAITRSDGSDQLWATYGIQIVNCVRYPSGTRKYSILVWWCNYVCVLTFETSNNKTQYIPSLPVQFTGLIEGITLIMTFILKP